MNMSKFRADLKAISKQYHDKLVEQLADVDDHVMHKYLEGQQATPEELRAAVRKATLAAKITPVLLGSSFKNKGVQPLLDAVIDYLPSPLDVPLISGVNPRNNDRETRKAEDAEPFAALAFKVVTDPYVGKLTYFRVYSGVLEAGSYILNSTDEKKERIGRLLQMHANKRQDIEEVYTGILRQLSV